MVSSYKWCSKKHSETSRSSSNAETREMYTGTLNENWIRDLFRSIGYPVITSSKLYEENQATIKRVMVNRITPQSRPLGILITAHYLRK